MDKEQIKTLRKTLGLSQEAFGKILTPTYSRQQLSHVELGTRPIGPKLITAIELLINLSRG